MNAPENTVITVACPPQRLRWLVSELSAAGVPFDVQKAGSEYHVQTLQSATPVVNGVLGSKPKRAVNPFPTDIRVIGFIVSLGLVVVTFMQSAGVEPVALEAGVNPLIARGVVVLVVGVVVTLAMSEGLLRDSRRWLFILGMMGLFLAAALWFGLQGAGFDLSGELARWAQ